jgi:hypothetical protein
MTHASAFTGTFVGLRHFVQASGAAASLASTNNGPFWNFVQETSTLTRKQVAGLAADAVQKIEPSCPPMVREWRKILQKWAR